MQAKHAAEGNTSWGIDGESGSLVDMNEYGVWEPFSVKAQTYKTAVEVSCRCFHSHLLLSEHATTWALSVLDIPVPDFFA